MSELHLVQAVQFPAYRDLFSNLSRHLCIDSVIEGFTPGFIYTDDPVTPGCGLLWNRADGIYLSGGASQENAGKINRLIRQELIPDATQRGIPVFTITTGTSDWQVYKTDLLEVLEAKVIQRRVFKFSGSTIDPHQNLPEDFCIVPVDEKLFSNPLLVNYRDMLGWVLSFWRSTQEFVKNGLGYAVLDGDVLASWSLTVFVGVSAYPSKQMELCVATAPAYRRRRLASMAAGACIQHCIEKGFQPHWHCDVENPASAQVAERVGFTPLADYPAWRIQL